MSKFQEIKVKVASLKTTLLLLAKDSLRKMKAQKTKIVSKWQNWGYSLRLAGKRLMERSRPHAAAVPRFAGQDFMESLIQRSIDARLHALLQLRTACRVGCEATADLKSDACAVYGWSPELIRAARKGATTLGFSERENLVLRYADDITRTPTDVDLLVSRQLRRHFTHDQIVEITAAICYENFRTRFRAAMAGQTTLQQEHPIDLDRATAAVTN
jgi:alkylhydroperoxidase family enzyme